jgi:hypothetical protein
MIWFKVIVYGQVLRIKFEDIPRNRFYAKPLRIGFTLRFTDKIKDKNLSYILSIMYTDSV